METDAALANYIGTKKKINDLLALPKITLKDIEGFSQIERECLAETATAILSNLKGEARDNFLDKIDLITPAGANGSIWQYNNYRINSVITKLMNAHGFMPSKNAIAEETGLSRQTVAKHLKEYKAQPEFMQQAQQFTFMAPQLLANVYKFALDGDIRAARLYFEIIGAKTTPPQNTLPGPQNNYIQINNTILSQQNLASLTAEQLNQIEGIIKG